MAGHGEGKLGLAGGFFLNAGDEQGAGVKDGDERAEPALVGVLGAEIAQQRIRDVTFEELGGPVLPFFEELDESVFAAGEGVATKEFGGAGWRTGAGVKERDVDFAAGECAVEDGEVPDDEGDKAEADAGFQHEQAAREPGDGGDVSEAEGEERGAADVEVRVQGFEQKGIVKGRAEAVEDEREAHHDGDSPDGDEEDERKRSVDAEHGFAFTRMVDAQGEELPGGPGGNVEGAGEAKCTAGTARKDDRLEGVEERVEEAENAGGKAQAGHGSPEDRIAHEAKRDWVARQPRGSGF